MKDILEEKLKEIEEILPELENIFPIIIREHDATREGILLNGQNIGKIWSYFMLFKYIFLGYLEEMDKIDEIEIKGRIKEFEFQKEDFRLRLKGIKKVTKEIK